LTFRPSRRHLPLRLSVLQGPVPHIISYVPVFVSLAFFLRTVALSFSSAAKPLAVLPLFLLGAGRSYLPPLVLSASGLIPA